MSLCACIRVLTTSNGCSARLETRPAEEPAMNEAVPLLVPGVPDDRFDASSPRLGLASAAIVAARGYPMTSFRQPPGENCPMRFLLFKFARSRRKVGTPREAKMEPPKDVSVAIKWQGKLFSVTLAADADVGSLKRLIEAETNVLPARQKLLNVKVGPNGGRRRASRR